MLFGPFLRLKEGHEGLGKHLCDCRTIGGLNGLEVLQGKNVSQGKAVQCFAQRLTVPHHGPAAHHKAPSQTPPAACCMEHRAPWTAWMQTVLFPAPISPRNPLMLLACSHEVASAKREDPMVLLTQVAEVPEPSESRYWCISVDAHS